MQDDRVRCSLILKHLPVPNQTGTLGCVKFELNGKYAYLSLDWDFFQIVFLFILNSVYVFLCIGNLLIVSEKTPTLKWLRQKGKFIGSHK